MSYDANISCKLSCFETLYSVMFVTHVILLVLRVLSFDICRNPRLRYQPRGWLLVVKMIFGSVASFGALSIDDNCWSNFLRMNKHH